MPGYSYAVVETALAAALDVDAAAQQNQFRARLKHLSRLGLPGIKAGKGARIEYTQDQVNQWLIALLMSEMGIDPVVTVDTIKKYWTHLKRWVGPATDDEATKGTTPNPVYFFLRPKLMSGAWTRKPKVEAEWIGTFRRYDYHLKDKAGRPIRRENAGVMMDNEVGLWLCLRNLTLAMGKLQTALESEEE
jgi:hypothetical protein